MPRVLRGIATCMTSPVNIIVISDATDDLGLVRGVLITVLFLANFQIHIERRHTTTPSTRQDIIKHHSMRHTCKLYDQPRTKTAQNMQNLPPAIHRRSILRRNNRAPKIIPEATRHFPALATGIRNLAVVPAVVCVQGVKQYRDSHFICSLTESYRLTRGPHQHHSAISSNSGSHS